MYPDGTSGVVSIIQRHYDDIKNVLVLVGPGNNGGDGFVIARQLTDLGLNVQVCALAPSRQIPVDAKAHQALWRGEISTIETAQPAELVVDAIFGTGLRRALNQRLIRELKRIEAFSAAVIAVDIPSGLCSDRGIVLGYALRANHTITFHRAKHGHYLADGPDTCGKLHVVDIGLHQPQGDFLQFVDRTSNVNKTSGHKYCHGHALIISGGPNHTGASRLSAQAALRIGAGLVTLATPLEAADEVAHHITSPMMVPFKCATHLSGLIASEKRWNALCIGPGLGLDKHAVLEAALHPRRPIVIDADALSICASDNAAREAIHDRCVLTPHGGEFARLFPDIARALQASSLSKVEATRLAAEQCGSTVLFKGRDTVIAHPNGLALHCAAYGRSALWLATAGSGDILSGMICGLLARGFSPFQAAKNATWLQDPRITAARRRYGVENAFKMLIYPM